MKLHSYFKDDEDILLLNTQYVRSNRELNQPSVLYITYRDLKTKQKKVRRIESPKTQTFITKREYRTYRTPREYMPIDKLDSYLVEYDKLAYFIRKKAQEDGRDNELVEISKDYPKEIFKYRHSYYADYDINDYVISSYALSNLSENRNISKAYFDIESDIYQKSQTDIDNGKAPIHAVSVVLPYDEYGDKCKHPIVFTVLLRNHSKYKEQEYFETHMDKFIKECHDEFDEKYNKPEFVIKVFDDEIKMLKTLFAVLHKKRPDFILIWNMGYDIPAIIKRLLYLNQNPINYFCHPDFDRPFFRYNYDNIYKNDFKNKSESFDCTSYSMWIDQMLNYANKRKAKSDYGGNSLDNIAHIELGAEKRKFESKNTVVRVTNAAEEEYWNFVKYSINDVLLQYGIDEKTEDTDTIFSLGLESGTRMSKAQKQSVYHKNTFLVEFMRRDIVPCNNHNISYIKGEDPEKNENDPDNIALQGALVGDPSNNDYKGIVINGKRSMWLFKHVFDEDFAAMYPNAKMKNNISISTQICRIIIDHPILPNENPLHDSKFMRATKLMEDIESKNPILLGKWLHLPTMKELIDGYEDYRDKTNGNKILLKPANVKNNKDKNDKLILHKNIIDGSRLILHIDMDTIISKINKQMDDKLILHISEDSINKISEAV